MSNADGPSADEALKDEAIAALLAILESHDRNTYLHAKSVAAWTRRISESLGFIPETMRAIERAAILHDLGKLHVTADLLNKTETLSEDDWAVLRAVPAKGAQIVAQIPSLLEFAPLIRSAHERFDGGGYPDGMRGVHIPLGSRIIAVADAYDAMVARRAYRQSATPVQALTTLVNGGGSQWDPGIIDAFSKLFSARPFSTDSAYATRLGRRA